MYSFVFSPMIAAAAFRKSTGAPTCANTLWATMACSFSGSSKACSVGCTLEPHLDVMPLSDLSAHGPTPKVCHPLALNLSNCDPSLNAIFNTDPPPLGLPASRDALPTSQPTYSARVLDVPDRYIYSEWTAFLSTVDKFMWVHRLHRANRRGYARAERAFLAGLSEVFR